VTPILYGVTGRVDSGFAVFQQSTLRSNTKSTPRTGFVGWY